MANTEILKAKIVPGESDTVLGNQLSGGVIRTDDGILVLKADRFRYNGNGFGREKGAFIEKDLSPLIYMIKVPDQETTKKNVLQHLEEIKDGDSPTIGIEIEGAQIDRSHQLMPVDLSNNIHPELMQFTLESATQPKEGRHLQSPVEIAQALADAIIGSQRQASKQNGLILYTSVPECGNFEDGQVSTHPYLQKFAPMVLQDALDDWKNVPGEVIKVYQDLEVDPYSYLRNTGNLNWPVHALHVHVGSLPRIDNLINPRVAHIAGKLRQTIFSKIMSLSLFNSRFLYGKDTKLLDVRSIIKRLLSTTHNSQIPDTAQELVNQAIFELQEGKIHSLSRYPTEGQHSEVRFRMDGYGTIESIEGGMSPDLRQVLSWAFFNQMLFLVMIFLGTRHVVSLQ